MDLPFLTAEAPGIGGRIKQRPEDFFVEEIPAYAPSGDGPHLFLWVEKRGIATPELTRRLARQLDISPGDIGVAGLKDKQAVTRQFVSVPAECEERLSDLETEDFQILSATRHGNKLRTGQLRGNRFSILVREVHAQAAERAEAIAAVIGRQGFPNYFGDQRFGQEGETSQLGWELLRGEKKPGDIPYKKRRFLLKFALSAAQSELFNRALAERIADGLFARVLLGDVMQVVASGGPFVVEDPAVEQARHDAGETAISGPLFGPKMKQPTGEVRDRETRLLKEYGLEEAAFEKFRKLTSGTRRPYAIRPDDLTLEPTDEGLRFHFTLPPGVYATTMLREFMKD